MMKRTREEAEEDEKVEIDPNDIAEDFSEFEIEVRKALWLLLKAIIDETLRSTVTDWLNSDYGKQYNDFYQML